MTRLELKLANSNSRRCRTR